MRPSNDASPDDGDDAGGPATRLREVVAGALANAGLWSQIVRIVTEDAARRIERHGETAGAIVQGIPSVARPAGEDRAWFEGLAFAAKIVRASVVEPDAADRARDATVEGFLPPREAAVRAVGPIATRMVRPFAGWLEAHGIALRMAADAAAADSRKTAIVFASSLGAGSIWSEGDGAAKVYWVGGAALTLFERFNAGDRFHAPPPARIES